MTQLVLGPGERADLLVDFRGLPTGALWCGRIVAHLHVRAAHGKAQGGEPLYQIMQSSVTDAQGFIPALPIAGMILRPVTPVTHLETVPEFAGAIDSHPIHLHLVQY